MIRRPIGSQSLFSNAACRALVLLAVWTAGTAALADTAQVGEVSLLIGEARVVRDGTRTESLRTGAAIRVGDRIETSSSGHVFVRFVDHGAVSLRPGSVLEVQAYRYDPAGLQPNEVRLRVEQGTGRSISGAATQADKSRFRLNTPIAAIGVRGTDFIVQTDDRITRAQVAEGAILVGALGARCAAQALGPCQHADARLLAADMGPVTVELRAGEAAAQLRPLPPAPQAKALVARTERSDISPAEAAAYSAGLLAAEPDAPATRRGELDATQALALAQAGLPDRIPSQVPPDLNSPSPINAQLAWGRWSFALPANDQVSRPFVVASIGRHITVGDERVGLFRADDSANPERVLPATLDGSVAFRLSRGHATFESASGVEAATIGGGSLVLDFGRRTFATALGLSSSTGGAAELRAAGDVRADGTFAVRGTDHRVAGAVTLDGREAGYLFERSVAGGLFRGTTLWGR